MQMKAFSWGTALVASHTRHRRNPGRYPALAPLAPWSRPSVLACRLPPGPSSRRPPTPGHHPRTSAAKWEGTPAFPFPSQEKARLFGGALQYKSGFFISFVREALCLAGRGQGSEVGVPVRNTLARWPGVRSVCLPLPGRLPVSGALASRTRCPPARESRTALHNGACWPERKRAPKGSVPQPGSRRVPGAAPPRGSSRQTRP